MPQTLNLNPKPSLPIQRIKKVTLLLTENGCNFRNFMSVENDKTNKIEKQRQYKIRKKHAKRVAEELMQKVGQFEYYQ